MSYEDDKNEIKSVGLIIALIITTLAAVIFLIMGAIYVGSGLNRHTSANGVVKNQNWARERFFQLCSRRFRAGTLDADCLTYLFVGKRP